MGKITVKNVSTAKVTLYEPSIKFNRELMPGRVVPLTDEEYEELTFDPGFNALLKGHYLKLSGVETEKQVEVIDNVYDVEAIEKMLVTGDVTAFARFIPTATEAERESAINIAVDRRITNAGILALMKKYCGIDVIDAISKKHDAEEK